MICIYCNHNPCQCEKYHIKEPEFDALKAQLEEAEHLLNLQVEHSKELDGYWKQAKAKADLFDKFVNWCNEYAEDDKTPEIANIEMCFKVGELLLKAEKLK
jgi:hypothetical protein